MTNPLLDVLDKFRTTHNVTLQFSQGTYHFYPENAKSKMMYIANHDEDTVKSIAFDLSDFDGLTVDGMGSKFIFHTEIIPFYLENSKNITIKNLRLDYARTAYSQGKIISVTPQTMEIDIDPVLYPWDVCDEKLVFSGEGFEHCLTHWLEFNAITNAPQYGTEDLYFSDYPDGEHSAVVTALRLSQHRVRLCLDDSHHFFEGSRPGNNLVLRHHPRSHPAFYLQDSNELTFENIQVYHATGIALIAERCKNITLQKFNVCRTPDNDRIFTAIADATHFVNCEGNISISDCLFENQLDDAVNVHGIYGSIVEVKDGKTVIFELSHGMQKGVYIGRCGQTIAILDRDTLQPNLTSEICSIVRLTPDLFELILSDDLPKSVCIGNVVENITQKPDVIIENCIFRNNRARGILLTCKTAIVRKNRFESAGAAVLLEGDAKYWFESGATTSILLEENEFFCCSYIPAWGNAPIQSTPSAKQFGTQYYHKTLTIRNNRFNLIDERVIYARNVGVITMENNCCERNPMYAPIQGEAYDIQQVGSCIRRYTCV